MTETTRLLARLREVTDDLCKDYPGIATADSWERLYALEQGYRGTNDANADLHALIEVLRNRLGLSQIDVADLGMKIMRDRAVTG
jgi:hypothetical protein